MNSAMYPLARAVRGPVMLIVLGVLFALDQNQGIGFRRTWPVLLVVFGVMKLIERLMAPAPPAYYPPPPPVPPAPPGGYQS